ncbi:MAG: hypothetical protein ACK6A4_10180, partial [Alphaproteobacteria bacterium]
MGHAGDGLAAFLGSGGGGDHRAGDLQGGAALLAHGGPDGDGNLVHLGDARAYRTDGVDRLHR